MTQHKTEYDAAAELRKKAEGIALANEGPDLEAWPPEETRKLVHELRVHQIELEMQNEELRRAHVEIDATRAKYFDLYDLAPVGYMTISEKGLIQESNLTAAILLDVALSELVKQPISRFILKEDQDTYYRHRKGLIDTGEPQECELRLNKSDGEILWARLDAAMAQNSSDEPVCRVVITDITDRKQVEKEKEKLQVRLRQSYKMEAIGTLAAGIAHEFNNLLQAITGYTQLLLMDKNEGEPEFLSLNAILHTGDRAAKLIRQLLQFSRKIELDRKLVNLNQEAEIACRIMERTISKNIEIELRSGDRLRAIMANPGQIEQIFLNLSINATDAMPDGGRLLIETENVNLDEEFAQKHIGAQPGHYVLLTIADTGHGMDRETQEKIFEPFFTTKEVGKGTGLGLSSVYGIVKAHGGYIQCESEINRGTTFMIYLPAIEEL